MTDNLFVMDPHEIEYAYRHATNKRQQISILTDLNSCSNQKIIDFLKERGIEVEKRPYKKHDKPAPFTLAEAVPAPAEAPQPVTETPQVCYPERAKDPAPLSVIPSAKPEGSPAETGGAEEAVPVHTLDVSAEEARIIATVLEHTAVRCSQEIFRIKREIKEKEEALAEQEALSEQLTALLEKFEVVSDVH